MKHLAWLFVTAITLLLIPVSRINAANFCNYGSTQARVQNNINIPWSPSITVGCEKSFNVGSFHNGTGQFTGDTTLNVSGPNFNANFRNGDTVHVNQNGLYTLKVTTNGQTGPGCTEQANVNVICNQPTPQPVNTGMCSYGNTQARVQNNINVAWAPNISIGCERVFNVGSFHNGTGQFANDTTLFVTGPGIGGYYANGNTIRIPDGISSGNYSLFVQTSNQSGNACQEFANVSFFCAPAPTSTPIPLPPPAGSCSHSNTQARVQQSVSDPWQKDIHIACNATFRIGSFHDGNGNFASDTNFTVTDPLGFIIQNAHNGSTLKAFFGGVYKVAVRTTNQSGPLCEDQATVTTDCASSNVPEIWVSMLRQYLMGSL